LRMLAASHDIICKQFVKVSLAIKHG